MSETVYVLTNYALNHVSAGYRDRPLDRRFLDTDRNYVFFLIDREVPPPLEGRPVLFERDVDPALARAGAAHLAEWAFLLAEAEHGFCEYPFFMVSSRFYEKNRALAVDLNTVWEELFAGVRRHRFAYLPSYDRPLRWQPYASEELQKIRRGFRPFNDQSFDLVRELYGIGIPEQYSAWSDFQCNYIGFATREDLLAYVAFYRPLLEHFFDEDWELVRDLEPYVRETRGYRNEKPLTFLLEYLSHLFFFAGDIPFLGLHYKGWYLIDERRQTMRLAKRGEWTETPSWHARWLWHGHIKRHVVNRVPDPAWMRLARGSRRLSEWRTRRNAPPEPG